MKYNFFFFKSNVIYGYELEKVVPRRKPMGLLKV